jgi:small-conductance mechanosensitive channel
LLAGAGLAIGAAWGGLLGNFAAGAFMLVLRPFKVGDVQAAPPPEVNLVDLTLLGPVIAVRPYCHNDHYWQVYFDTNEAIARTCREAGWPAPMPVNITRMQQLA